jgi:hypothetical protein
MRRRQFIAGLGSAAAWPVMGDYKRVLAAGTFRGLNQGVVATHRAAIT